MSEPPSDAPVVDARGERCPVPVVMVARAVRDLPDGSVVVLWSDDPVAAVDVPAWAWMRGHAVVETPGDGFSVYTVDVGGGRHEEGGVGHDEGLDRPEPEGDGYGDDGGGSDRST